MDLSTLIVDLLRKSADEKAVNAGTTPARPSALETGGTELSTPGYAAYRREAEAMGEQVMTPDEFRKYRAAQ